MKLSDNDKREICRCYCVGFGHTPGKPISTASFTIGTGRDYNLYTYNEVVKMIEEISLAQQIGELSVCQKSVLHQLKSYGVIQAFHAIALEEESSADDKH